MRAGRKPCLAAAAFAVLTSCGARGDSALIELHAPAWVLAGFDVTIEIRPRGALQRRDVGFTVLLNGDELGRFGTEAGTARVALPAARLRPGVNRVMVKTGNTRSSFELRIVPLWQAGTAAALVAAIALAAARRARRRAGGS